jgi:hypothetical protein
MRLFLDFAPTQTPVHRLRLTYAFRLFCAIYDHEPILYPQRADAAEAWLSYNKLETAAVGTHVVRLSNMYAPRSPQVCAPLPTRADYAGESTALFYAPKESTSPDWLAEIFEWVSCADEYSVTARDSVGRIPFSKSYVGRHGLDIERPYAAIAMLLLQRELCKVSPRCPPTPSCPDSSSRHFVVNTHDVDFLPLDRLSSVERSMKNALISLLLGKSPQLFARQMGQAAKTAVTKRNPLNQIPGLLRGHSERAVGASFYFVAANRHRRDVNYRLDDSQVIRLLHQLTARGVEVGVHGSYTSLEEPGQLRREFISLRELGFPAHGGRQHWLRFTMDRLIEEVGCADALYDASVGWGDRAGFRAGACFAFPPYNFKCEGPSSFLEIPLVIMDQTLQQSEKTEQRRYDMAARILAASRRYGWGGTSVLWHPNAFGGSQLSPDIGRIYWRLLDEHNGRNDSWISAANFISAIQKRYSRVGLLAPRAETEPDFRTTDFVLLNAQNQ